MNPTDNISPEDFSMIELYVLGKMDSQEAQAFETKLKNDADLRKEVEIQRELQLGIEMGGLRASLDEIHEKVIKKDVQSKTNWFGIAAGIAAIIAVSLWALNIQSTQDELFAEYATVDPGLPVTMGASDNYSFNDAMVDYKAGKYDKAVEKWSVLNAENPQNTTIAYYLGAAYFNLEKYTEALPYFEKTLEDPTSRFQEKAQWYSILSWLKTENIDAILETTPLSNSAFESKIKAIQEELNN